MHVMIGTCMSDLRLQWGKVFSQPCCGGSVIVTGLAFPPKHAVHYDARFLAVSGGEITPLLPLLRLS